MKIYLKRTGGFTGIPFSVSVDTDQLEEKEREAILALVASAQFFSLPEKIPSSSPGADRFQYRITIERSGQSHTVEAGESSIPDALQPLIRHLIARRRASE